MGSDKKSYVLKEKKLIAKVKSQLGKLFNVTDEDLEENIEKVFVQNWSENPYVLGGYSFIKLDNAYKGHRKNLAKSVQDKLFFAGEATSKHFSSTVQGGLDSGKKAAYKAIDSIKRNRQ